MQQPFTFNEKTLDFVKKYRTERNAMAPSAVTLRRVGLNDQESFVNRLGSALVITIYMALEPGNLDYQKRKLAYFFNENEPKKLWFPREPDKYYLAIQNGDITYDESQGYVIATASMLVPDGKAYSVNPRIFNNIKPGTTGENLVLDPEFKYRYKYWKPWGHLLNEKRNGSEIMRGDFSEWFPGANDPAYGNWFQVNSSSTRPIASLKKGDKFSAAVDVRIIKASTQPTTTSLVIEERAEIDGDLLYRHTIKPQGLTLNTWQSLRLINYQVQNSQTKALNLAVSCYDGAIVDISRPQFNLGATLLPYAEPTAHLEETVEVLNQGTYEAWPILRAKMNGENGLIAFANNDGAVLQFGQMHELDALPSWPSDKVLNIPMRNNGSYFTVNNGGATTYPNYNQESSKPNLAQGSIDWSIAPEGMTPVFAAGSAQAWHGPRARITSIPKNFQNLDTGDFKFVNRFDFATNTARQGRMEYAVVSGTDILMAMVIRDSSATKDEIIVECWAQKKLLKTLVVDRKKAKGSYFEVSLVRDKVNLEYQFAVPTQVVKDETKKVGYKLNYRQRWDAAKDVPVTELSCWFQRFQTTNHVVMHWWDSQFTWFNEVKFTNIPNRFSDGDIVEIDVKERKVYVNDIEDNQLHALGNQWSDFSIQTGYEVIKPICSNWANMFELEIELREAYV